MSPLNIEIGSSSHSAYDLRSHMSDAVVTHTLAILVANEPGVLARVIGLFSGRGYNIESLTVAEVDHEGHRSRITIVTSGTPQVLDQIRAQLDRLVPVHRVSDLTDHGPIVERELALVKVAGVGEKRVEALRIAAGAGYLLALTGDIVTMPGLPREPAAWHVDLDDDGNVTGI